jgi:fimbrial chaperone protein
MRTRAAKASLFVSATLLLFSVRLPERARAGSLEVQPVVIEVPAPARSAVLMVANRGTTPTNVQIRSYAWQQNGNADSLVRTGALFASPPIAEIPPGSSQIFRILLRQPPQDREASYRLLLDELPTPASPGQIRMALRLSLPVFAQPEGRTRADLHWQALQTGPSGADIVAVNRGTRAEKVIGLGLSIGHARPVPAASLANSWILPGAERRWHVDMPRPLDPSNGALARLTGHLGAGPLDVATPILPAQ